MGVGPDSKDVAPRVPESWLRRRLCTLSIASAHSRSGGLDSIIDESCRHLSSYVLYLIVYRGEQY